MMSFPRGGVAEFKNLAAELIFETLSGPLSVTSNLEMSLPLVLPVDPIPWVGQDPNGALAMACVDGLKVADLYLDPIRRWTCMRVIVWEIVWVMLRVH